MTISKEVTQSKNQTIKHVFSYSMAVGLTQVLMMTYTVILMRWVTPEQFGIVSANYATTLLLSFLINWGMNEWLVKAIPTSENPNALTGSLIRFKGSFGLAWGILLWLLLPLIQPSIYQKGVLTFVLIDVWVDSCINLLLADLLGNEKVKLTSIILILSRVLRLCGLLILMLLNVNSIEFVIIMRLASSIVSMVGAWTLARPRFNKNEILNNKEVFKKSSVFNASELFNLLFTQADITMLTWFIGDAALIGSFAIVIAVINMIMTIPLGIYNLLIPQSVKTYQTELNVFRKRMYLTLTTFVLLAIIVWTGIVLPGTTWIIKVLGEDYSLSARLLLLATPILFIRVINQVNNVYLVSVGQEKKRILPQAIVVLLKVTVGIFIVVKWQAIGLIILGIVVDAILLLLYSIQSFKHYGKRDGLQTI